MQKTLKILKLKVVNSHINTMLRSPKIHYKSSDLFSILREHFGKDMNLARIKVMSMMICALCKVPPEPHEPLSDRYFQIIVIYLGFKITFYIFATETDN